MVQDMKKFLIGIIGGILVMALVYFGGGERVKNIFIGPTPTPEFTKTPLSLTQEIKTDIKNPVNEKTPVSSMKTRNNVLILQYAVPERVSDARNVQWLKVLIYSDGIFKTLITPDNVDREVRPVTDGTSVYYLIDQKDVRKQGRSIVAVRISDGKQTLISDSTPLVKPRNVFMSLDGKNVAFFLDSTQKKKTELWTYSVEKARKRVSLELLTQNTIGPFWDANGGFIVRDGTQFLRGSPNRTGADKLQVKIDWENILPGQSMILSPGGTQIVYLLKVKEGKNETYRLKVWDIKESIEKEIASFNSDKLALLGWNSAGALMLQEGGADLKIWNITKEKKESFNLESNATSVVISGDGAEISYVLPMSGGEAIVFREASSGKIVLKEKVPDFSESMDGAGAYKSEIIQYLRTMEPLSGYTQASSANLAKEAIVGYVMGHIREIAEPKGGERVLAQRVWFTHVPGAVYVDYLVGNSLWRRLIQVDGMEDQATSFTVIGIYSPAAGEWVLTKGRELTDTKTTDLYEFDSESGKWFIKDQSAIQP